MNKKIFLNFIIIFFICYSFNFKIFANRVQDIKEAGELKVVTNAEFPPLEYKSGDEIVGIDVEIAKEIANRLGVELKISNVSFDAMILELHNGLCDFIIAGISYSDDRARSGDFSDTYFKSKQTVIVKKNSNITYPSEIADKKIGVYLGYAGDIYCTNKFPNAEIIRCNNSSDAALDLMNNRLDAIVIDELHAKQIVNAYKDDLKILSDDLFVEEYKILVPKGETDFLNYINTVLADLQSDGTIDKIIEEFSTNASIDGLNLKQQIYYNLIYKERYMQILKGLQVTFSITIVALIMGIVIGFIVAIIKSSRNTGIFIKTLKFLCDIYLSVIRGTPVVVQLFIICYLIFASTGMSKIVVAMITFGINSGAYVAEIVRSGISSINYGQIEAGLSLGLKNSTIMSKIILPQTIRNVIPALGNEFISLIKETSVAGFIGIVELSKAGDIIKSQTYLPLVPLVTVALIYLIIVLIISFIIRKIEASLHKND